MPSPPTDQPDSLAVQDYLRALQNRICASLETYEPSCRFAADAWTRADGGGGDTRVLGEGAVFERAGVNFSEIRGDRLPPAATQRRPQLTGGSFAATGLSLVLHPRNPYAPTVHMNLRHFIATPPSGAAVWWFGGGFDLTPYYGFAEDARHWHATARAACDPFGAHLYPRFKQDCDEYFFLPHRQEARGIGGLFFDDFDEGGFAHSFALVRSVGDRFLDAYLPILGRRKDLPYGERERDFQLYRRGRYVEFNLVQDRGTLFGLQSGGRIESILMSLPPLAAWRYDWRPAADSPEAALYRDFLPPREWV